MESIITFQSTRIAACSPFGPPQYSSAHYSLIDIVLKLPSPVDPIVLPQDVSLIAHFILDDEIAGKVDLVRMDSLHYLSKITAVVQLPQNTTLTIGIIGLNANQKPILISSLLITREMLAKITEETEAFFEHPIRLKMVSDPHLGIIANFSFTIRTSHTEEIIEGILTSKLIEDLLSNLHMVMENGLDIDADMLHNVYQQIELLSLPEGPKSYLLNELGHLYSELWTATQQVDYLGFAINMYEDACELVNGDVALKATYLHNLGLSLVQHFGILGDIHVLSKAVIIWEKSVNLTPSEHPQMYARLSGLAVSLFSRFESLGDLSDINNSIKIIEDSLGLIPDGHSEKPGMFSNLGNFLQARFQKLDDLSDLNATISALQEAVRLIPEGHPERPRMLNNVGHSLQLRFRRLNNLNDMNSSIMLFEDAVNSTPDGHPEKLGMLINLANCLFIRFERLNNFDDIKNSIMIGEEVLFLTPDGHSEMPQRLSNLGSSLQAQFKRLGDLKDINNSIKLFEDAVNLTHNGDPEKPGRLISLGNSLQILFERSNLIEDINKSIFAKETAICLMLDGHPEKPAILSDLGWSLFARFVWFGDLSDVNNCVALLEDAVALTPNDNPNKLTIMCNLAAVLSSRFQRLGDLNDINKSVVISEDLVGLAPDGHPDKPRWLICFANSLHAQFEKLGDLKDLNTSIIASEFAVQLIPEGHPERPGILCSLGYSLQNRFYRLGELDDINNSVRIFEDAVNITEDGHFQKPEFLDNLGSSLDNRFERLGNVDDMKNAVIVKKHALYLTPNGHHRKSQRLSSLGGSLLRLFDKLDNLDDIHHSVVVREMAVLLIPDGHLKKPDRLSSLGKSLLTRAKRLGKLDDINKSIMIFEDAVLLTPDGHPDKPGILSNFGHSLYTRFEMFGDLNDIHSSVTIFQDSVNLTPDGHHDKPHRLSNLGSALLSQFERLGDFNDMHKAILIFEDAEKLLPDGHTLKHGVLSNLGSCLQARFETLGDLNDIHKSIMLFQDILSVTPDEHSEKPRILANLGDALQTRFKSLGDLKDINYSVILKQKAVHLTPKGHSHESINFSSLGSSFYARFQHKRLRSFTGNKDVSPITSDYSSDESADMNDIQNAADAYSFAACSGAGSVYVKFNAAVNWAKSLMYLPHSSPLAAYNIAVPLIPKMSWLGLTIPDRHTHLHKAGNIICSAVACALESGRVEMALEWAEQGRSIIWSQLSELRTPVNRLRDIYPHLAQELEHLSHLLDSRESSAYHSSQILNSVDNRDTSFNGQYHNLAQKRDELIEHIHSLDGFETFLMPKSLSELLPASHSGPIITVNAASSRCDALILMSGNDTVLHVALDQFTFEDATRLYNHMRALLQTQGNLRSVGRAGKLAPAPNHLKNLEDEFAQILSELWIGIVKPVLDALAFSPSLKDNLPHIWWCLTGPLAFLPVHAAGIYRKKQATGSKLSDFAISSYTSSIGALIHSSHPKLEKSLKVLAVALPVESGLPCSKIEVQQLSMHASRVYFSQLIDLNATVDNVVKAMQECHWVHFACHGVQNISNPTMSALLLSGGSQLTLSEITKLSLPHAELAFLSACQTATGTEELSEEAVHLAAGMLMAGYQGVIATMWSIRDDNAVQVADAVYSYLLGNAHPDVTQAAYALHIAVKKLHEGAGEGASFFSWVPFIHVGV